MNRITSFLFKHSQKIAFASAFSTLCTAYIVQPYYEVLNRWAVVDVPNSDETPVSDRVKRLANEVCQDLALDSQQRDQLDFFVTHIDQSIAIGSLRSPGYAFIGLPTFLAYSDVSQIPLEAVNFLTRSFPYGPFSPKGNERLRLMVLSDPALRFLIARELFRTGARAPNSNSRLRASARTKAMLTVTGSVTSLYVAYQATYVANRAFRLVTIWSRPLRLLAYTGFAFVAIFLQHQLHLAWRRYLCFSVDQQVANLSDVYANGALDYYEWRLRWNRFWFALSEELYRKRRPWWSFGKAEGDQFDPVRAYQLEKAKNTAVHGDQDSGYYLPTYSATASEENKTTADDSAQSSLSFASAYRAHPRLNASGDERWAGDGDCTGFGWTEMLVSGWIPWPVAGLYSLFTNPATCHHRQARLRSLVDGQDQL